MARPPRAALKLPAPEESAALPYLVIRDYIAARITGGEWPAGTQLPSERQLHEALGRNRGTIRDALLQLEGEGLVYRQSRSGWFVSPPRVRYDPARPDGFMTYVAEQNRTPQTRTLSAETLKASGWTAECLGVAQGAPSYFIRRLRLIDQRPVLVEQIWANPAMFPGLLEHSLDGSLTQLLRNQYGAEVVRMEIDMSPCLLPEVQAEALRVVPGTPGLYLTRRSLDAAGRVVEYDQEFWRHDAIAVHVNVDFSRRGLQRRRVRR
ncbi:MAG: UTRA domain-containing protein [Pseudomonadota bacterium]